MRISNFLLAFTGFGFVFSAPALKKTTTTAVATPTTRATSKGQTVTTALQETAAVGRKTTTTTPRRGRTTATSPTQGRTTSSSTPTSAATGTPVKSSGKRGLAYNDPALTDYFSLSGQGSKVSWAYNWASDPYYGGQYTPNSYNNVLTYVPMLWSNASSLTSTFQNNVQKAISSYGADSILGFNEPDGCGQGSACMTMDSAVTAWQQYIQPWAGKVLLGAPATINAVGPEFGANWLEQFIGNCTRCTIDFIPVHWYGDVTKPSSFTSYVQSFWTQFGKPIWVTEFGTPGASDAQIVSFLQSVLPWLDSQSYVKRYSYFMDLNTGSPYLLNSDDTFTDIGSLYNSG